MSLRARALSLTCPPSTITVYSTAWQWNWVANLIGLDLHKRSKGIEGAERLPGSLAGADHGFIERHDLDDIAGEDKKALGLPSVHRRMGLRRIEVAKAANPKQGVLRTAIALFLDSGFAPPKIAENRIFLSDAR